MNIVLGSGPSAVFCALALLERGQSVTMVDPGERLENHRHSALEIAAARSKQEWSPEFLSMIRDNTDPNVKGVPKKLVYGSDFPFRVVDPSLSVSQSGCDTLISNALGGLSNAWGANIVPLLQRDVAEWPISIDELWPHYKKVLSHIPVSSYRDDLTELFGDCFPSNSALPQSAQIRALLTALGKHREALKAEGIFFGGSRLAVKAEGCQRCGLCLYGCPHRLIYSSADSLELLRSFPTFSYRGGALGRQIKENADDVAVMVHDLATGSTEWAHADRIFVGCGPVSSTALMLASFGAPGEELRLKDSQYFLTPFVRFRPESRVTEEALHTLSQAIVEIVDEDVCDKSIHLLFYSYNDMYYRALRNLCGRASRALTPLLHAALGRLLILQGYLHSDYSGEIGVSWKAQRELHLSGYTNPLTRRYVRRVHARLFRKWRAFGGVPIVPMSHIGAPGKSYHLGGSLPMSSSAQGWNSDTLGRVKGLQRVHVVDASVLPTVPAQNSTLTAMANAYRIGKDS